MADHTFHVHRYDPEADDEPEFESYDVPVSDSTSVLDGLFHIQESLGKNLSFRFSCRQGVCGSCCMEINGQARLACQTPVTDLDAKQIRVRPMYNLPIIKDLVVDMEPFFEQYRRVRPYLAPDDLPVPASRLIGKIIGLLAARVPPLDLLEGTARAGGSTQQPPSRTALRSPGRR